jgi:hypothetical protein
MEPGRAEKLMRYQNLLLDTILERNTWRSRAEEAEILLFKVSIFAGTETQTPAILRLRALLPT